MKLQQINIEYWTLDQNSKFKTDLKLNMIGIIIFGFTLLNISNI